MGQVTRGTRYEGFEGLGGAIHFEEEAVNLRFADWSSLVDLKVAVGQYQYLGSFKELVTHGEGIELGPGRELRD